MKYLNQYYWHASQAFEGLIYVWPVTLVLLLFICSTAINYIWVEKKYRLSLRHIFIFSPLLVIIGTLSLGIFLRYSYIENPGTRPPSMPHILVQILFWVQIPLAFFIGYKLKEIRWLAVAIITLEIWYALWCTFLADMSVTDDWLWKGEQWMRANCFCLAPWLETNQPRRSFKEVRATHG